MLKGDGGLRGHEVGRFNGRGESVHAGAVVKGVMISGMRRK